MSYEKFSGVENSNGQCISAVDTSSISQFCDRPPYLAVIFIPSKDLSLTFDESIKASVRINAQVVKLQQSLTMK